MNQIIKKMYKLIYIIINNYKKNDNEIMTENISKLKEEINKKDKKIEMEEV